MIAGPSEITIICDGKTNPDWIAMDLFSQAEHDELAQPILISSEHETYVNECSRYDITYKMPRKSVIKTSLGNRGFLLLQKDLKEAQLYLIILHQTLDSLKIQMIY